MPFLQTISQKEYTLKGKAKVKPRKNSSIIWLLLSAFIAVGLLLFCQFYFGDSINKKTTFYPNTHINGVDVSGLTRNQAENLISQKLVDEKDQINLVLIHEDKKWEINGEDLSVIANTRPTLDETIQYGRNGNIFANRNTQKKIEKDGLYINIPYEDMLGGLESEVANIVNEIENLPIQSGIIFQPEQEIMFTLPEPKNGKIVKIEELKKEINSALSSGGQGTIIIPTDDLLPQNDLSDFLQKITKRSSFTTNYEKSSSDRKSNIKLALSKSHGLIVEPGQEISFNDITGLRTKENGYKSAKIIIGGKYVDGVGGGVCQASTTLYNALIRCDLEILQVNHHTLPASYVPLSFDAMVSEGYADLKFKNNLDTPIFIKTICTNSDITVEIYGEPMEEGLTIQTRAELVKVLGHGGDDILKDTSGEYEDKVLYKGEYYRLKYPQEGYESKGYIEYYKNGEKIDEKQIRHDKYLPQNGIIIEGCFTLEEGMTLPESKVKYIAPQKVNKETEKNAKNRWNMT